MSPGKQGELSTAKWATIGVIVAALLAAIATIVAAIIQKPSVTAVTATATLSLVATNTSMPSLVFDFLAEAPRAVWTSNPGSNVLSWPGHTDDPKGYALWVDNAVLEDGSQPPHVLRTDPEWMPEGDIVGDFTLQQVVQPGDHFRAKVGFLNGAGGTAEFVVEAYGGTLASTRRLVNVMDNGYDKILRTIDADLTPVTGATAIRLIVNTGATSGQDWAVWLNPRIEH